MKKYNLGTWPRSSFLISVTVSVRGFSVAIRGSSACGSMLTARGSLGSDIFIRFWYITRFTILTTYFVSLNFSLGFITFCKTKLFDEQPGT